MHKFSFSYFDDKVNVFNKILYIHLYRCDKICNNKYFGHSLSQQSKTMKICLIQWWNLNAYVCYRNKIYIFMCMYVFVYIHIGCIELLLWMGWLVIVAIGWCIDRHWYRDTMMEHQFIAISRNILKYFSYEMLFTWWHFHYTVVWKRCYSHTVLKKKRTKSRNIKLRQSTYHSIRMCVLLICVYIFDENS